MSHLEGGAIALMALLVIAAAYWFIESVLPKDDIGWHFALLYPLGTFGGVALVLVLYHIVAWSVAADA